MNENSLLTFGENSRLVYLPSGSIVCIGGFEKSTGTELRDALEFMPQDYHILKKLPEMLMPRDGPACKYVENYIFALGGDPSPKTCEKFSIIGQKWLPLSSMFYPRKNSTATSALGSEYIFVFGGEPLVPTGSTIEKYSIKFNH